MRQVAEYVAAEGDDPGVRTRDRMDQLIERDESFGESHSVRDAQLGGQRLDLGQRGAFAKDVQTQLWDLDLQQRDRADDDVDAEDRLDGSMADEPELARRPLGRHHAGRVELVFIGGGQAPVDLVRRCAARDEGLAHLFGARDDAVGEADAGLRTQMTSTWWPASSSASTSRRTRGSSG